jgi:hypothetical protein
MALKFSFMTTPNSLPVLENQSCGAQKGKAFALQQHDQGKEY